MRCSLKMMLVVLVAILLVSPYALKEVHFILKAGILSIPLVSLWIELNLYLEQDTTEDGGYKTLQVMTVYLSVVLVVVLLLTIDSLVLLGYNPIKLDFTTGQFLSTPTKLVPYQTIVGFSLFAVVTPVSLFILWKKTSDKLEKICLDREYRNGFKCILSITCSSIIFLLADVSLTIGITIVSLLYI